MVSKVEGKLDSAEMKSTVEKAVKEAVRARFGNAEDSQKRLKHLKEWLPAIRPGTALSRLVNFIPSELSAPIK